MIIKADNIWNSIVTWKDNARASELKYGRLIEFVNPPDTYKPICDVIRSLEYDSDEYKQSKTNYPMMYIAGKFVERVSKDANIEYNNLMTVDVDAKDNKCKDLNEIRDTLFNLPYVAGVFHSLSNKGFYVVIPIKDQLKTESYYKAIFNTWNNLYGINADKQACDLSRGRFISYDADAERYMKHGDVQIWVKEYVDPIDDIFSQSLKLSFPKPDNKTSNDNDLTYKAIKYMLDKGFSIDDFNCKAPRSTWYHIGCDFARYDDGEDLFITFSQNSKKYDDDDKTIKNKFAECEYDGDDEAMDKKYLGMCKRLYGTDWWK